MRSLGESEADLDGDGDGDGLGNLEEFRHDTDPTNPDTDGDGAHDGREVNAGFDPLSPNSLPVDISGAVVYAGWQPGLIHVVAVAASIDWATNYSTALSDPGAYAILDAPGRTDLWVRAFRDMNTNGVSDPFEAYGEYALNPINATGDVSGIVLALTDPDLDGDAMPDWWEVRHWGNTGQDAGAETGGGDGGSGTGTTSGTPGVNPVERTATLSPTEATVAVGGSATFHLAVTPGSYGPTCAGEGYTEAGEFIEISGDLAAVQETGSATLTGRFPGIWGSPARKYLKNSSDYDPDLGYYYYDMKYCHDLDFYVEGVAFGQNKADLSFDDLEYNFLPVSDPYADVAVDERTLVIEPEITGNQNSDDTLSFDVLVRDPVAAYAEYPAAFPIKAELNNVAILSADITYLAGYELPGTYKISLKKKPIKCGVNEFHFKIVSSAGIITRFTYIVEIGDEDKLSPDCPLNQELVCNPTPGCVTYTKNDRYIISYNSTMQAIGAPELYTTYIFGEFNNVLSKTITGAGAMNSSITLERVSRFGRFTRPFLVIDDYPAEGAISVPSGGGGAPIAVQKPGGVVTWTVGSQSAATYVEGVSIIWNNRPTHLLPGPVDPPHAFSLEAYVSNERDAGAEKKFSVQLFSAAGAPVELGTGVGEILLDAQDQVAVFGGKGRKYGFAGPVEIVRSLPDGARWSDTGGSYKIVPELGGYVVVRFAGLTTKAGVPKVDFNLLWETPNKANQIFNPTRKDDPADHDPSNPLSQRDANDDTYGTPRNNLYLVPDPADSKYKATLKADIEPASVRPKIIAAVYVGSSKVSGSDKPFDTSGECALEFTHTGTDIQDFTVKVGFDANGNNQLDQTPNEILPFVVKNTATGQTIGDPTIRGTSPSRYNAVKGYIDNTISIYARPHAAELLRIFRDGNASGVPAELQPILPPGTRALDAMGGAFSEWLTHNSGAAFNDAGQVTLNQYSLEFPSETSTLIGDAKEMRAAINDYYNTTVKADAMATLPVGSTAWYPSSTGWYTISHPHSPSWVPQATVELHDNNPLTPDAADDVNGTVGRGRVTSHQARYQITKKLEILPPFAEYLEVEQVRSIGEVLDLYDFNYESAGMIPAAQWAAMLQIGYGKGAYGSSRDRGKIFFSRFAFDVPYTGLP